MKRRITGTVEVIVSERPGAQEIIVRIEDEIKGGSEAEAAGVGNDSKAQQAGASCFRKAINLIELTGRVAMGERVILNTVAVELGLGTGGKDFVISVLRDQEPNAPAPGHILKLRYTPLQTPVLAAESPESPHHDALCRFDSLNGLPVVCAQMHSQIPAILAGMRWGSQRHSERAMPRIAYIMTDGAALPLALSQLAAQLREREWISATITAGQAFGGDHECVNIYSGLATASIVVGADLVIVCQGPGNVGTGTPLGFSGIEQGQAINAVASLGGKAIAAARISFADPRARHRGLSHHTVTVLQNVARASAIVPLPYLPGEEMQRLLDALEETQIEEKHQPMFIKADDALDLLQASDLNVTTMGRGVDADRPFFLAACAAGIAAAQLLTTKP
jgi:hypothetical protein